MASSRRTLSSAFHDRRHHNVDGLLSVNSSSHKLISDARYSSQLSVFALWFRRFLAGISHRSSRKGQYQEWRRTIFKWFLFFFLGLVIGLMPFGHVEDVRSQDFASGIEIQSPHVNAELNYGDRSAKPKEFGVDLVSYEELQQRVEDRFDIETRKQLIVVTPTYNRALQAYFLNRLAQVLRLVPPPLLWIVVEMNSASMETAHMLRRTGVMYRHLVCAKNLTNFKDRGVYQRNTALEHIEHHKLDGIVYFADDDNVYSLELFESLREVRRFGTWPVAMLAQSKNKAILEGPVCNGSQVLGWHTTERSKKIRRFHVDMSGFAFNSTILWDPKRWKRPTTVSVRQLDTVKEGLQETTFIEQVVEDEGQMEGTLSDCLRIMNWHLHLEARNLFYPSGWLLKKNLNANLPIQ